MPIIDAQRDRVPPPFGPLLLRPLAIAVALGLVYFVLTNAAEALVVRIRLPESLLTLWLHWPRLGGWLVGALQALLSQWLIAVVVGLILALLVRRDLLFYGAVATGAALVIGAQMQLDGWYALLEVGPQFWLAHKLNALVSDPVGLLSTLTALPVCSWAWGKVLT